MGSNIECYVSGCKNPVLGACAGYKEKHHRFMCREHSIDGKLCVDCARQVAADYRAELRNDDFLQTAQELFTPGCTSVTLAFGAFLVLSLVLISVFGKSLQGNGTLQFIVMIVSASPVFLLLYLKMQAHQRAREIARQKPGFDKFFDDYARQRRQELGERTKRVVGTAVVGGLAVAYIADQVKLRTDLQNANRALNDLNRKVR